MSVEQNLEFKGKFFGSEEEFDVTEDNLRSTDTMEILLGISEGPIQGLKEGQKSFFLNDTKLEGNFKNYYFQEYLGDPMGQTIQSQLGGFTSNTIVEQVLYKDIPITRTTYQKNINALEIRLIINKLYKNRSSGVFQQEVTFKIEYKQTSSSTWLTPFSVPELKIKGKTTSPYVKEYRWDVPSVDDTYDIRITKLAPIDDNPDHVAEIMWSSFQEVLTNTYNFKNLACIHFSSKANKKFSSIPDFSGIYRGRLIKVPTNYDPILRSYSGVWDGTFKISWTDDPAWILYDLITNETYGLSSYHPVPIDKWEVYEASKWCSEKVPDGKGGFQPRFSFNGLISEAMDAKDLARYVAGSFNAMFFSNDDGSVSLYVDKPKDPTHLFTPENVLDQSFEYTFTDITTRYNDITVGFINPDLNWQEDRRRIYDQSSIDKYGRTPYNFVAVGCTNMQQALRAAKYKLVTSLTETTVVTFKTNRLAHSVFPGEVILIGDPDLGYSVTGRVLKVDDYNNKKIHLRDPITLYSGINYKIAFKMPDGIEERTVDSGDGYSITLTQSVPPGLPEYAVFSLQEATGGYGLPKPFRVIEVKEVEGDPDLYEINAIEINPNKWNIVDNLLETITEPVYSFMEPKKVEAPTNLQYQLFTIERDGKPTLGLLLRWNRPASKHIVSYEVLYSFNSGPVMPLTSTYDMDYEFIPVVPGVYEFYIYAVSSSGIQSLPLYGSYEVGPENRPVLDASDLVEAFSDTLIFHTSDLHIKWKHSEDELRYRYKIEIRNSSTDYLYSTWYTEDNFFVYTKEMNAKDGVGREIKVVLYVEDKNHVFSPGISAIFVNPSPKRVTNFQVVPTINGWQLSFDSDPSVDLKGYKIWGSPTGGFIPSDNNLLYFGANNQYFHAGAGTMYFRVAAIDTFETNPLYSDEVGATVTGEVPPGSISTSSIVLSAVMTVQTNTIVYYNSSTNNQTTTYTVPIASFTTAPVTEGKLLIFMSTISNHDYIARAYANSSNTSNCNAYIRIKKQGTSTYIWEQNVSKSSANNVEVLLPPTLILYESVAPSTPITYELELYAKHDSSSGRTTQVTINPFKIIIMEAKR